MLTWVFSLLFSPEYYLHLFEVTWYPTPVTDFSTCRAFWGRLNLEKVWVKAVKAAKKCSLCSLHVWSNVASSSGWKSSFIMINLRFFWVSALGALCSLTDGLRVPRTSPTFRPALVSITKSRRRGSTWYERIQGRPNVSLEIFSARRGKLSRCFDIIRVNLRVIMVALLSWSVSVLSWSWQVWPQIIMIMTWSVTSVFQMFGFFSSWITIVLSKSIPSLPVVIWEKKLYFHTNSLVWVDGYISNSKWKQFRFYEYGFKCDEYSF